MKPLEGRVAVVTGASRGIGRAIVMRLAADGADCVVTFRRDHEQAKTAAAAIEQAERRVLVLSLDLTEPDEVAPAFERIARTFGRADILVANAAATVFRPTLEQKRHNVQRTFAMSVESLVVAVQAAVPLMTGPSGRIVAISGIDSFQAMTGHGALGAAKAAVESLVRTLALELGPRGITVNAVSPGFIETDSSRTYVERALGGRYRDAIARLEASTPVRRTGTVDDVAGLVGYLVSDAAGFLTGQTIVMDGGLTIASPLNRLAPDR